MTQFFSPSSEFVRTWACASH